MSNSMSKSILEVVNPFDLKPIGEVQLVDWPTIDGWLSAASQLHKKRANWLPMHQRIAILKKTAQLMQGKFDELAFQIANEGGKPLMDAKVEVTRAIDGVELCIKELGHLAGTEIPMLNRNFWWVNRDGERPAKL